MSVSLLFAASALALAVVAALVFARRVPTLPATPDGTHLSAARKVTGYARAASAIVFALVASALSSLGGLGQWAAAAPGLAAAAAILTLVLGDVASWRSARTPGLASLERRTVGDFLPRRCLALATGATVLSLAILVAAGTVAHQAAGSDPWQRAIAMACLTDEGAEESTTGPFPGFFYGLPIMGSLVATWTAWGLAAWSAVCRPRNGSDQTIVALDNVLRTRTLEAASSWLTFGAALGVITTGAFGVRAALAVDCLQRTTTYVALHTAAALISAALALWALARLIRPTTKGAR